MQKSLGEILKSRQADFGLELSDATIEKLVDYSYCVYEANELLHLVAPCTAEEFAVRHILESLFLTSIRPEIKSLADIGSGAGLPGIPLAIVLPDTKVFLVESKPKKVEFLKTVTKKMGLSPRCAVIGKQYAEARFPGTDFVVARAIDGFSRKVRGLLNWASGADLAFYAGANVKAELEKLGTKFDEHLIPESERRFIYVSTKKDASEEKENAETVQ
ncbi:MAG: RsmG family class I SAM-dependent methyltransferase [Pyrinomonadaceae bacterium]